LTIRQTRALCTMRFTFSLSKENKSSGLLSEGHVLLEKRQHSIRPGGLAVIELPRSMFNGSPW
jgi:hypothetical protein